MASSRNPSSSKRSSRKATLLRGALVAALAVLLQTAACAQSFPQSFSRSFSGSFSSSGFNGSDFGSSDLSGLSSSYEVDPNLKPWQSRPPYLPGQAVQYNNGTIFYQRQTPGVIMVPFFTVYWWLAIIILVVVVVVIYMALCIWICCHFEKSEQKKAKKVVEAAYLEDGFFDLDAYCEENGLVIQRSTSTRSVSSSAPGGGGYSNPYVKRGSDSDYEDGGDGRGSDGFISPTGSPDEHAFTGDDDDDLDDDDVVDYGSHVNYSNSPSGSGSDDEDMNAAYNFEVASDDSRSSTYRMPMGRRRSQR